MIQIRFVDGVWAPMLICDVCSFPIAPHWNPGQVEMQGIAIWSMAAYTPKSRLDRSTGYRPVLHVHKGHCDVRAQGQLEKPTGWESLDVHLFHICHNVGLAPEDLAVAAELEAMS